MKLFSRSNRRPKSRLAAYFGALAALAGLIPLLTSTHGYLRSHSGVAGLLIGVACGVAVGVVLCIWKKRRDRMNPYLNG